MSAPLAFLTGATGFIGSRVARDLAERGYRLRCLVRSSSDRSHLERLGAEFVEGDVTAPHALTRGMDGAEVACHIAAIYDVGPVDAAQLERTNVLGTRSFLEAVDDARPARALYVSTVAVYQPLDLPPERLPPAEHELPDEGAPLASTFDSVYQRTKVEAHRLALDAMRRGLPVVIAAPAFVYGPRDQGPVGRLVMDVVRGRLPALPARSAWFSFVYVEDVAQGIADIIAMPDPRGTFILSGENASLHEFIRRVALLAGRTPPRLRLPVPIVRGTGRLLDVLSRITGRRFSISREGVDQTTGGAWLASHARATRALDWHPRPLSEGLPPTVEDALARR